MTKITHTPACAQSIMAPSDPQQNGHDETASDSDSRLLSLPAELRNRIYRLVLLRRRPTRVKKSGFSQGSGILATCKQIRHEALKICYYKNIFRVSTPKWNTDALVSFNKQIRRLGLQVGPGKGMKITSITDGPSREPHWANLLEWARLFHSRTLCWTHSNNDSPALSSHQGAVVHNVGRAIKITACQTRDLPWRQVEEILAPQRLVLALVDERWLEEKQVGEE